MGIEAQKSALPTLFHFARVRVAPQPHGKFIIPRAGRRVVNRRRNVRIFVSFRRQRFLEIIVLNLMFALLSVMNNSHMFSNFVGTVCDKIAG